MQRETVTTPERTPDFEQALGVLRQFRSARRRSARRVEHCELCSAELHPAHPHLVELTSRRLVCACDPCAMLFDGMERSKYKRVPRHVKVFAGFQLSDAQWESLFIPINLAFFFRSSIEGRTIALYPSPAGAVESLLTLEAWNSIEKDNPQLCADAIRHRGPARQSHQPSGEGRGGRSILLRPSMNATNLWA